MLSDEVVEQIEGFLNGGETANLKNALAFSVDDDGRDEAERRAIQAINALDVSDERIRRGEQLLDIISDARQYARGEPTLPTAN